MFRSQGRTTAYCTTACTHIRVGSILRGGWHPPCTPAAGLVDVTPSTPLQGAAVGRLGRKPLHPEGVWSHQSAAPCGQGLSSGHAAGDGEEGSVKHVSAAANPALHLDRLSKLLIACDII